MRKQILALLAALALILGLMAGCGSRENDVQQPDEPILSENTEPVQPEDVPKGVQPEAPVPTDVQPEETEAPVDTLSPEPETEEPANPEPEPEPAPEPAETVPDDGTYTASVVLEGGTGRATVESPAALRCENGRFYAVIVWSSPNFDYMKVGGEKYLQTNTEGNSTFEIPVAAFDQKLDVIADTVAMSEPHEVEYTLYFDSTTLQKQ